MSVWSQRVTWMQQAKSVAQMARETAIPYRILLDIKNGRRSPTTAFLRPLNNLWGREGYRRMVDAGTPRYIAQRLRGGSYDGVDSATRVWAKRTETLALGSTALHFRDDIVQLQNIKQKRYYDSMLEKIREGTRKTKRSFYDEYEDETIPYPAIRV